MPRKDVDVLLINPPYHAFFGQENVAGIPYGLLSVATVLDNGGFKTAVYDGDVAVAGGRYSESMSYDHAAFKRNSVDFSHKAWKGVESAIKASNPRIVGIGVMTAQYWISKGVARMVKELDPSIPVVVGGPHPTILPERTAAEDVFDFVVRGEGELTTLELVRNILRGHGKRLGDVHGISYKSGDGVKSTAVRHPVRDLDSLPAPDRDLLIGHKNYPRWKFGHIITSRGCPFGCTFCNSKSIWGRGVRFRSPKAVVDEIEYVYENYRTREFNFLDDTFNLDERRVFELCRLIRDGGLDISWSCNMRLDRVDEKTLGAVKSAGCYYVRVGVESGSQEILDGVSKGITLRQIEKSARAIKDAGLELFAWFMLGNFGETPGTVADTERILKTIRPDVARFTLLTPYPGTEVSEEAERRNAIITEDWSEYTGLVPLVRIDGMSSGELKSKFDEMSSKYAALDDISFARRLATPGYILKRLRENADSPRNLLGMANGLVKDIARLGRRRATDSN